MQQSTKQILWVSLLLFTIFFLSFVSAHASTVWETTPPQSSNLIDFPINGTNATGTPNYGFYYELPSGIQFDRIQISVPDSQTNYNRINEMYIGTISSGNEPWNCPNSNCVNGNFTPTSLYVNNASQPTTGTQQYIFTATTTLTSTKVLAFYFDPNTPTEDVSYNATYNQPNSYGVNGGNYSNSQAVPTIKLCNGTCNNNSFSPTPNLLPNAWARILSPQSGTIVTDGQNVQIQAQFNNGTTTATKAVLRFNSSTQTISPYEYTINQSGLTNFTYSFNVPSFQDTISYNLTLETPSTNQTYGTGVTARYSFSATNSTIACMSIQTSNCEGVLSTIPLNKPITINETGNPFNTRTFTATAYGMTASGYNGLTVTGYTGSDSNYSTASPYTNTSFTVTTPTQTFAVSPTYTLTTTDSFVVPQLATKEDCEFSIFDMSSWWDCTSSFIAYLVIPPPNALNALAWYGYASTSPATQFMGQSSNLLTDTLQYSTPTSTISTLSISIPINVGNATITLPIINFEAYEDYGGDAVPLFRFICLGTLVIFAMLTYVGNVQRALRIITYKGLDT